VWEVLCEPQVAIAGLMIDEAHCLVEWGDSFRPAYRRLGMIRPALLAQKKNAENFSIAAFTATADFVIQDQLCKILRLDNPDIFTLSPYRPNLKIGVKIAWTGRCRQHLLLNFLEKYRKQSGLIYVRSRRDSEFLVQWLKSLNYRTAAYHAGLGANQRREIEQQWLTGNLPFVICTNAFGLGINKPDIRWIAHFHPPHLLSEYLQEIGRGGRDGLKADTLTLVSEPTGWLDPTDQQRRNFFNQQREKQAQKAQEIAQKIPQKGDILSLKKNFPDIELSLAFLDQIGQLEWLDPFHYQLHSRPQGTKAITNSQQERLSGNSMKQYLYNRSCRWAFLLTAFGLKDKTHFRCGHCDRCDRR
jgi:ATP-dependent DNA helicase RecQ